MTRFSARPVLLVACLAAGFALKCGEPSTGGNIVGADSLAYTLRFASYLGGASTDLIRDVVVDPQGNIYAAGSTLSPDFPTTTGVFQPVFNQTAGNLSDAFITKFGPGGQVIWSTFLGGPGYERIYGMEVDELGYLYVAGRAGAGFPVTPGAFQTAFGGSTNPQPAYGPTDGFVCKIRPDGTQVVFCSYFGNEDYEPIRDLAIDANHDIYVASSTPLLGSFASAWFANAYQKTIRGGRDALIAKIKGDGSQVLWATLLGGAADETIGISIRVGASGVYMATTSNSPDMPTPNGFSHTLSGVSDVYVAKLSLDGSQLLYGTYVGGSGPEGTETHHLTIDGQGNAFLAVAAPVTDFPTTPGVFQPSPGGKNDILIVKISSGGALTAATFLGGREAEWVEGVGVDGAGNFYLTGFTNSSDFPLTGGQGPSGGKDLLAVTLSADLSHLLFSRRLGGSGDDYGRAVAVGSSTFVVAGTSDSPNLPTAAAAQTVLRGGIDGAIAAFVRTP
jgi:hypothetical protein